MNAEFEKHLQSLVTEIESLTDFQKREKLSGCAFTAARFAREYGKPGENAYKQAYLKLYDVMSQHFDNARKDTKNFKVDLDYFSPSKPNLLFGYSCSCEERSIEEVMQRLKEKEFRNLKSDRVFKSVEFTNLKITEIN